MTDHYRCTKCGTIWRQNKDETWSLADADQKPEQCCDNNPNFLHVIEPAMLFSKKNDPGSFDVDEDSGVFEDEGPYCACDEQPVDDELASNVCSACGKLLS